MGIGDEIMVTGEVRRRREFPAQRFAIRDPRPGKEAHRWESIWAGNPSIVMPGQPYDRWYENGPGHRPYIVAKAATRWTWREYGPHEGELYLTPQELALSATTQGRVLVHPTLKARASPNKAWGFERWQELVEKHKDIPWLQIGMGEEKRLAGVEFLHTPTFRDACGALTGAKAVVLQEGGLHHAAAAQCVPAVVIFGGFISPRVTGYAKQVNLFIEHPDHPLGCGSRAPCIHCASAMQLITVNKVARKTREIIG